MPNPVKLPFLEEFTNNSSYHNLDENKKVLHAFSIEIIYEMFCKNTSQSITNTLTEDKCQIIVKTSDICSNI